ncbi:MAG: metal ABC transporter ATP-binding protein [Synergistaceae bacterium]|jgi:zinc transport system ATP-binding protein|nr:metal ABC transporter ATP-binding protein [Synergistaceae bacterium]
MPLLACRRLSLGYGGNVVLNGVDFQVNSGDYLCVVGENGSGKSTLMKGLLRLQPPMNGEVAYGDGLKANMIGYLPQRVTTGADFPAGAYEVVLSGRLGRRGMRPFYTRQDKEAARANMKMLEIDGLTGACFGELSGGQQQRVLLARALCSADRLLLLDEPVAGLDPVVAQEFYDILGRLNASNGMTIIMVSHDVGRAAAHASHVLHLSRVQRFFGPRDEYLKSDVGKKFTGGDANA